MAGSRKGKIRRAIRKYVNDWSVFWFRPGNWYVGVTCDVERRKSAHRRNRGHDLPVFQCWKARSAADAAAIEKRFLDLGMQGAGGGWNERSCFVYVYKLKGPKAFELA